VSIKVKLVLEKGYEIQEVLKRLEDNINSYFSDKSLIKYVLVGATITQTEGISDYEDLLLNDATDNIVLAEGERAVVSEVLHIDEAA